VTEGRKHTILRKSEGLFFQPLTGTGSVGKAPEVPSQKQTE
jgi:hypothetical protein